MAIRYLEDQARFLLSTAHTQYEMRLLSGRYLLHEYYGSKDADTPRPARLPYRSFSPYLPSLGPDYSPDIVMQECPGYGCGDFRSDAFRIRNAYGNDTTQFSYLSHRIYEGRNAIEGLPYAESSTPPQTLEICMQDEVSGCLLKLYYTVYEEFDVISRYYVLENKGSSPVTLKKGMSLSLDIPGGSWECLCLPGAHVQERLEERIPLHHSKLTLESGRGATSHQMNSFFMLTAPETDEQSGPAYGFHFVYSGNFLCTMETDQNQMVRVQVGLHPDHFEWLLEPGEHFSSPEALMCYSDCGMGNLSRQYHRFINDAIVRKCPWPRHPIVLNTWEGNFFDIDEEKMMTYAHDAADCHFDMLVMDDGWFGERYNDRAGLGDWYANPKRFREGLPAFVQRIKQYPLLFGIWIEPEMVNPDSELYRKHPEWVLQCPGRTNCESRNQLVLDFSNPKVINHLKENFRKTFAGVDLDYIKWDFNRQLSEVGSPVWPPERQKEVAHRYMLGVYELYQWFRDTYPDVMIENCSGGGGRYDLGMMKYSTQVWASDNTDPHWRMYIQYGSSLGYPSSVMSCHVSNHAHAIEDPRRLAFRFHVAAAGMLGYEFDFNRISQTAKDAITRQIREYRTYAHLIETGDLYRLISPMRTGKSAYYYCNADASEILLTFLQSRGEEPAELLLRIPQAQPDSTYLNCPDGTLWKGQQLQDGISITTDREDEFSRMFYFVIHND